MNVSCSPPAGESTAKQEGRKPDKNHTLMRGIRQLLIMALGLVEDWLEMPRTIQPKRKRIKSLAPKEKRPAA